MKRLEGLFRGLNARRLSDGTDKTDNPGVSNCSNGVCLIHITQLVKLVVWRLSDGWIYIYSMAIRCA